MSVGPDERAGLAMRRGPLTMAIGCSMMSKPQAGGYIGRGRQRRLRTRNQGRGCADLDGPAGSSHQVVAADQAISQRSTE